MVVLGCSQKEQKISKETTTNIQKSQEVQQEIIYNTSINKNQEILNEISNTDALDSSLEELDLVE